MVRRLRDEHKLMAWEFERDDSIVAETGANFEAVFDEFGLLFWRKCVGAGVFDGDTIKIIGNSLGECNFVAGGAVTDGALELNLKEFLNNHGIIGRNAEGEVLNVEVNGDFAALASFKQILIDWSDNINKMCCCH